MHLESGSSGVKGGYYGTALDRVFIKSTNAFAMLCCNDRFIRSSSKRNYAFQRKSVSSKVFTIQAELLIAFDIRVHGD